ncbi:class IV adenylate cyclase [Pseudodesulfovibrio karagichevae]|uniref:Class IV adenylate cyclase n=1 Tax=Pseudodesulfovibrio karagichevae TaxID=3239305 RepID=A0ABV4JXL0_9BACT
MSNNIEIKASVEDAQHLRELIETSCGKPSDILIQRDIFYRLNNSRLKMRNVNGHSELIYYSRANTSGPKLSKYLRVPIIFPGIVHFVLKTILGVRGVVNKKRVLFFSENTRIHLDEVDKLGAFLELEVVLEQAEDSEAGIAKANQLMSIFNIKEEDLISRSYIDLLENDIEPHNL